MGTQRERAPVRTEVRWQDIGCPEQPGHHPFRESYVNVVAAPHRGVERKPKRCFHGGTELTASLSTM